MDNSRMVYFNGSCDAAHLNAAMYITQMEPRAAECVHEPGEEDMTLHYPTGVCFKLYGTEWSVVTCEAGVTVIRSWSKPKCRPPPRPDLLNCDGLVGAGSLGVSYEVNTSLVDVVSFEVALASDTRRRPFLHFTDVPQQGVSTAAVPGLVPGERYVIEARAHLRNQSEGNPDAWSNMTEQSLVCVSPLATGPSAAAAAPAEASPLRPKTRWLEVYRQNTNGDLPDFLDDHNSADLFGAFATYAPLSSKDSQHPITRYCVEMLDVLFNDTMSTTTTGRAVSSPFVDFGSCMGGQCMCQVSADRIIARQPRAQIEASCPSLDDTMLCKCSKAREERTQMYTGMMPAPLPFRVDLPENLTLPEAYPWAFTQPVHAHWYSHPGKGRCPPGADVGTGGCTWQRAAASHSVYIDDLVKLGLNQTVHEGGRISYVEESVSMQDVEIGERAFAALQLPPCGAPARGRVQAVYI